MDRDEPARVIDREPVEVSAFDDGVQRLRVAERVLRQDAAPVAAADVKKRPVRNACRGRNGRRPSQRHERRSRHGRRRQASTGS